VSVWLISSEVEAFRFVRLYMINVMKALAESRKDPLVFSMMFPL